MRLADLWGWLNRLDLLSLFELLYFIFVCALANPFGDVFMDVVMVLLEVIDAQGYISGIGLTALLTFKSTFFLLEILTNATNFATFRNFDRKMTQFSVRDFFLDDHLLQGVLIFL